MALWSDDVKSEGTSRVTWEIEPVGDSCRLTVTHDQLREGANDELYGGWPMILSGLKTLLETGRAAHHARLAALLGRRGIGGLRPRRTRSRRRCIAAAPRSGAAAGQAPPNFASRFSTKASTPSTKSSEPAISRWICASSSSCSSRPQ